MNLKSGLHIYSNKEGRELKYRLNLQDKPEGLPLLVVLHGYASGSSATKFKHEGWNVLAPIDDFGYKKSGSWWLGENGDFFLFDMLQTLIKKVSIRYACENKIYFYGSSMGGYGAILHGIHSNARAVYANVPQIQFSSSRYFSFYKKHFQSVFGINKNLRKEDNLVNYLNKTDVFPIFFLCENMIEQKRHLEKYLEEHTLMFALKCYEYQIKIHLELLPYSGHRKNYGLKEVLEKFEKYAPVLKDLNKSIQTMFRLEKNKWIPNKSHFVDTINFNNNGLLLKTNVLKRESAFYLISGDSNLSYIDNNIEKYLISNIKELDLLIEIGKYNNCEVSCYIIEFSTQSIKVKGKAYMLSKGVNNIKHFINQKTNYLKIAFRITTLINGISNLHIKNFNLNCSA